MAVDDFPEGDFTKTKQWAMLRYGQPAPTDVLQSQNHMIAKKQVYEAGKQEAFKSHVEQELGGMKTLMKLIAEKNGIDAATVAAALQTHPAPVDNTKIDSAPTSVDSLSEEFHDRIYESTKSYLDADPSKFASNTDASTAAVIQDVWTPAMQTDLDPADWKIIDESSRADKIAIYSIAMKRIQEDQRQARLEAEEQAAQHDSDLVAWFVAMSPEFQGQLVEATRGAMDVLFHGDLSSAITQGDDEAVELAADTWFDTVSARLGEGDKMTLEGWSDEQKKTAYLQCVAQLAPTETRPNKAETSIETLSETLKQELLEPTCMSGLQAEFVEQLYFLTKSFREKNPKDVKYKRSGLATTAMGKWQQHVEDRISPVIHSAGKDITQDSLRALKRKTDNDRVDIMVHLNKLIRNELTGEGRPSSKSRSPVKGDNDAMPSAPTSGLGNIPELKPKRNTRSMASPEKADPQRRTIPQPEDDDFDEYLRNHPIPENEDDDYRGR